MKRKSNPPKFERCVRAVKKRGGAANAYAVCTAAGTRKNPSAAYDAGFKAMLAASARHGTTNLSPSTSQRDDWRESWRDFMRGWNEAKKRKYHNNPASDPAAEMSEEFHGTPAQEEFDIVTEVYEHDRLADCGELVKLEVIPINGGPLIDLKKFEGARLAMSPKGYPPQLYIEGGDQSVDLAEFDIERPHELEVLGHLKFITYYTVKHHLGRDGGEANYRHKFNDREKRIGTKAANRPTVLYDVNNELLMLAGGEYEILPEGIDN